MKKSKSKSLTKKISKSKNESKSNKNKTSKKAGGCLDWFCGYENNYSPSPITIRNRKGLTLGMKTSTIKNMSPSEKASMVAYTVKNVLNKVKGKGSPSEAYKNLFRLNKQHKQTMKEFELNRKRERGKEWLAYWNRDRLNKGIPMIPKIFDQDIPDGRPTLEYPGRSSEELAAETINMENRKRINRKRRKTEASKKRHNKELKSALEKSFTDNSI